MKRPDIDDVGRFTTRLRDFGDAMLRQLRCGRPRGLLRQPFDRIDAIVVDAGLLVGQGAGVRRGDVGDDGFSNGRLRVGDGVVS